MKIKLTAITLLFPVILFGQYKFKLKEHIIPASCMLLSGASDGIMDYLQFHYEGNSNFWQPKTSWTNKYKNGDPLQKQTFRGKYLTFTTDGWHLMKFSRDLFTVGAVSFKITQAKKKWYIYLIEGSAYWIINRIGFIGTYNLVFKK